MELLAAIRAAHGPLRVAAALEEHKTKIAQLRRVWLWVVSPGVRLVDRRGWQGYGWARQGLGVGWDARARVCARASVVTGIQSAWTSTRQL